MLITLTGLHEHITLQINSPGPAFIRSSATHAQCRIKTHCPPTCRPHRSPPMPDKNSFCRPESSPQPTYSPSSSRNPFSGRGRVARLCLHCPRLHAADTELRSQLRCAWSENEQLLASLATLTEALHTARINEIFGGTRRRKLGHLQSTKVSKPHSNGQKMTAWAAIDICHLVYHACPTFAPCSCPCPFCQGSP